MSVPHASLFSHLPGEIDRHFFNASCVRAALLLKMLQFRSKPGWALSNPVALLRWNLFTHRNLWKWIYNPFDSPANAPPRDQLQLNLDSRSKNRAT